MQSDIWVPIKGYEGYYEVSMCGLIRSVKRTIKYKCGRVRDYPQRLIKPTEGKTGYMSVMLSINRKTKRSYVHRLVYENHLGVNDGFEINHIDADKKNNALYNLECITHKDNINHAIKLGVLKRDKVGKFCKL